MNRTPGTHLALTRATAIAPNWNVCPLVVVHICRSPGRVGITPLICMNRVFQYCIDLLLRPFRPDTDRSLTAINRARVALGLFPVASLPAGQRAMIDACPMSQLLPGIIGATGISFDNQEDALRVASAWGTTIEIGAKGRMVTVFPPILRLFVRDFDLGAFPSLIRNNDNPTIRQRISRDRPPVQRGHFFRPSDDRRAA